MRWIDAPIWVKTGRFIKWERVYRDYTQEELALKSGIDLMLLKRMERGKVQDITIEQAYRLVLALKCSVEEIIPMVSDRYLDKKHILG